MKVMRWKKSEEGVLRRTIDKKEDRNQTNKASPEQPCFVFSLIISQNPECVCVCVSTSAVCVYVSVHARQLLRCCVYLCESFTVNKAQVLAGRQVQQAGPEESYCNSQTERERRWRWWEGGGGSTLLKVPTGQSFEVAHIGI